MKITEIPQGAVVVGVDGSDHADHALDWAARNAAAEARPLVLVHALGGSNQQIGVMTHAGIEPTSYLDAARQGARAILAEATHRATQTHRDLQVESVVTMLDARSALLQASETASLVVMGSRGRGPVATLLLGSVSSAVAGHARSAVVVVRPQNPGLVRRGVMVGIDGTAGALPVLEFAFREASILGLPLTAVHSVLNLAPHDEGLIDLNPGDFGYDEGTLELSEALAGFGEKFPDVRVERHVVRAPVVAGLAGLTDKMDLVVVGHRHQDLYDRVMFGSAALGILEHAATTVAIVPEALQS